jgi:FkbM family methyltransferase
MRKLRTAKIRFDAWKRNPSRLILKSIRGVKEPVFVQIGSNDGKSNDPIFQILTSNPACSAFLVEPIPTLFQRLKTNYAGRPNTTFINAAIANGTLNELPFYHLAAGTKTALPYLPSWFDQVGSFQREHILKHFGPEVEPFIASSIFPTLSLKCLLESNQITKLDVLHIDAEGYDWIILSQLDLQKHMPVVILFEHSHLSEKDLEEAKRMLSPVYRFYDLGDDYFCRRR